MRNRILRSFLFLLIRSTGLPYLFRFLFQRDSITVLMYHDTTCDIFEKHLKYLIKRYTIIDYHTFISIIKNEKFIKRYRYPLLITFDDGHKNNFTLLSLFENYKIVPVIFLTAALVDTNRHYWWREVIEPKLLKKYFSFSDHKRLEELQSRYSFNDEKEYDSRHALNAEEIDLMKSFVTFQAHSMTHPCLVRCSDNKSYSEINDAKKTLSEKFDLNIEAFAFPNGDYSERELAYVKESGYLCAFSCIPGYNNKNTDLFQLKRISPTDNSGISEFVVKSTGFYWICKNFLVKKKGKR